MIAMQHLKYATAPNSRTMMPPWRRTSFVVIAPQIDIGELLGVATEMCSCDLHASNRAPAFLLSVERRSVSEGGRVWNEATAGRLLDPAVVHV